LWLDKLLYLEVLGCYFTHHQAILPEHLTAYKLHPEYQRTKLSAAQGEVVNEFLVSKNPTFIAEMITY